MNPAKPISGADSGIIVLAMALGAAVLGFRLGWQDYWWDEHVTLMFTRSGWRELLVEYWGLDTHRPVYYALQKAWNGIFGESVWAVRSLPVVITLLTVPVFSRIARQISPSPLATLTVLLLVSSPMFVYQGREIRMYCLMNLFLSLGLLFAVIIATEARADQPARGRRTALLWAGFAVTMAAAFYAQAIALFLAVLFGVWILAAVALRMFPVSVLWQALGAGVLYSILIIPALIPFLNHLNSTLGGSFWVPEPSFRYIYEQTAGAYSYPKWAKPVVGLMLLWGFWSLRRIPHVQLLLAVLVIGLPLMVLMISFAKPIFMTRVIAWASFVSILALAAGLCSMKPILRWGGFAFLLVTQAISGANFYPPEPERSDYAVFRDTLMGFNPETDELVIGYQVLEPALRWYYPHIFSNTTYAFLYSDWNHNVIDLAFQSTFVPRAEAHKITLDGKRLFVFWETEPRNPVSEENQVTEALATVIDGRLPVATMSENHLQLDIYALP